MALTLDEFADFLLPTGRIVNQNEVYKQLFDFRSSFVDAVVALGSVARPTERADEYFRVWDLYRVVREVGRATMFPYPGRTGGLRTNRFPNLHWLSNLTEQYWLATEQARLLLDEVYQARFAKMVREPKSGRTREETQQEFRRRFTRVRRDRLKRVTSLASDLPDGQAFWKESLASHASSALELRQAGFGNAARLCSWQLDAATELAMIRLKKDYREIRKLVGHISPDLTMPALTAASFSVERRAFDKALDEIEKTLPLYNRHVAEGLRLTMQQCEEFLHFLQGIGLQEWLVEYSAASWDSEQFATSTHDRRIAVAFGRVRTITVLLEEAVFALAERTTDKNFAGATEAAKDLFNRLRVFVKGPIQFNPILNSAELQRLYDTRRVRVPPIDLNKFASSFTALGMSETGLPQDGASFQEERVLAALILVRNFVSHRFPLSQDGSRPSWFAEWGRRLAGINRTILWAALILWALSEAYRTSLTTRSTKKAGG